MSEFRSQVIEQAHRLGRTLTKAEVIAVNGEYAAWANKEITSLRQQLEQAEARVAELEYAAKLVRDYPGVVEYVGTIVFDSLCSAIESSGKVTTNSFILRKQAEAVEDVYEGAAGFETDQDGDGFVWARDIKNYAQRLRQQADEADEAEKDAQK